MIPIGDAMKAARISRNLTQRQVASNARVPRTFVSKVENNRTSMSMGSVLKLSEAIGIDAWRIVRYMYQHGRESQTIPSEDSSLISVEFSASSPRH